MLIHLHIVNILLFLFYLYGLGYLCTFHFRHFSLENFIFRLGVGLGCFSVLGILLNFFGIPLDWRIFFGIALLGHAHHTVTCTRFVHAPIDDVQIKRRHMLFLLCLFLLCVLVYSGGGFSYPWLEDDDPWTHAAGIKYIALEKNLNPVSGVFHYINPYPPGYDLIFAIMHQTHPSLSWVLKFFNGFIVALSYIFFYVFSLEFTRDRHKALVATFVLLFVPCYLTHFIWAHALVVTLFFPALYALMRSQNDKKYIIPAGILIAAIFLVQPTQSFKFCILVFLWMIALFCFARVNIKNTQIIFLVALILSAVWWVPVFLEIGANQSELIMRSAEGFSQYKTKTLDFIKIIFDPAGGTGTRNYTFKDYIKISKFNLITNPVGLGEMLSVLGLLGLPLMFLKLKNDDAPERAYALTVLLWLLFTFLGMNTKTFHLPFGLFPFRFWMLFAIPVTFLVVEVLFRLAVILKARTVKIGVFLAIILCMLYTSGLDKFDLNTNVWPWGAYWPSKNEMIGYVKLREELPANTKVFTFTDNLFVIGFDMHADYWSEDYRKSFQDAAELPLDQLHAELKRNHFEYLLVGQRALTTFGEEFMKEKITRLQNHPSFQYYPIEDELIYLFKIL